MLGAIGNVAALKQEQVDESGGEVVALLPINFFKVKKDATPKAPVNVLGAKAARSGPHRAPSLAPS